MNDSSVRGFKDLQDEQKTRGIVGILLFGTRDILDMTMRYNETGITYQRFVVFVIYCHKEHKRAKMIRKRTTIDKKTQNSAKE